MPSKLEADLSAYFSTRADVAFAVLFGSAASGRRTVESDVDIAVYLVEPAPTRGAGGDTATPVRRAPTTPDVEDPERTFPNEDDIWAAVECIAGSSVDLVVLNRAPATVAAAALLTGTELAVNDRAIFTEYSLVVTSLAEEERDFADDFVRIKERSRSLSEIDRSRLVRIVDFLDDELEDADEFVRPDLERYATDRTFRRSIERWVENLVNASIDAAKIVLASERRGVPQTYRETLEQLGTVDGFREEVDTRHLARNTRVRNMLAHEYLDLRYSRVHDVADDAARVYGELAKALRGWMRGGS